MGPGQFQNASRRDRFHLGVRISFSGVCEKKIFFKNSSPTLSLEKFFSENRCHEAGIFRCGNPTMIHQKNFRERRDIASFVAESRWFAGTRAKHSDISLARNAARHGDVLASVLTFAILVLIV